jgi:dissimilatory sulfite reductase related protein
MPYSQGAQVPEFIHNDIRVEVDDKGYLVDDGQWNKDVARAMADHLGIQELTSEHWQLIDFLRQFQKENGAAPMIRVLCKGTGFALKEIYELFPAGPSKGACRVAGLPRPDSCV